MSENCRLQGVIFLTHTIWLDVHSIQTEELFIYLTFVQLQCHTIHVQYIIVDYVVLLLECKTAECLAHYGCGKHTLSSRMRSTEDSSNSRFD